MLPFHGLHYGLQLVDLFAHVVDGVWCNEHFDICVLVLGPYLRLLLVFGQCGTHQTAGFVAHELAYAGWHAIEAPAGFATKACEI